MIRTAILWAIQLLLAAFFGFVGYMKTFAPMTELATHHAWVAGLPPLLARSIGLSEMVCALLLLVPGITRRRALFAPVAAAVLLVNQLVAVGVHADRGELPFTLGQNLTIILLLALVACGRGRELLVRPRSDERTAGSLAAL